MNLLKNRILLVFVTLVNKRKKEQCFHDRTVKNYCAERVAFFC